MRAAGNRGSFREREGREPSESGALSAPSENLLVEIYRLTRRNAVARTRDLALRLGVRMPTVTARIMKLAEAGWLAYTWRRGVTLTERGHRWATKALGRRRLLQVFLERTLGMASEAVDAEVRLMAPVVSDRMVAALETFLGERFGGNAPGESMASEGTAPEEGRDDDGAEVGG